MQNEDHNESTVPAAEPVDLMTLIPGAYQTLQQQVADNQAVIQQHRHQIAELRTSLRQRSAELNRNAAPDMDNHHDDLHENKVLVQNDDCATLIHHAEQIRDSIYHNSRHTETLLPIVTQHLALLETRLHYIRTLETLLEDMNQGETLRNRQQAVEEQLKALAGALGVG